MASSTRAPDDRTMMALSVILEPNVHRIILWGEEALRKLGIAIEPEIDRDVMLVLEDQNAIAGACQRLRIAGFVDTSLSFGIDTRTPFDAITKHKIMTEFGFFDLHTCRFVYRLPCGETIQVALIPSSYAHLSANDDPAENFTSTKGFLVPKAETLLISFVRTLVCEPIPGCWQMLLSTWASHWLFWKLGLSANIMDECDDAMARNHFMINIRRSRDANNTWAAMTRYQQMFQLGVPVSGASEMGFQRVLGNSTC